jgi:hypothetical protein
VEVDEHDVAGLRLVVQRRAHVPERGVGPLGVGLLEPARGELRELDVERHHHDARGLRGLPAQLRRLPLHLRRAAGEQRDRDRNGEHARGAAAALVGPRHAVLPESRRSLRAQPIAAPPAPQAAADASGNVTLCINIV